MNHFELVSEYKPTGDQPQAIKQLYGEFKEFFPNNAVEYFVSQCAGDGKWGISGVI